MITTKSSMIVMTRTILSRGPVPDDDDDDDDDDGDDDDDDDDDHP